MGLYKIETRHDEYEYFIYVQTHQTAISKQLYLKNINMKSTTNSQMHGAQKQSLKDFIDGNEYKYMLSVNQRNARRLG